jgi:hypothetical protein
VLPKLTEELYGTFIWISKIFTLISILEYLEIKPTNTPCMVPQMKMSGYSHTNNFVVPVTVCFGPDIIKRFFKNIQMTTELVNLISHIN